MSEHQATFVDLCIEGKVLIDEIDDFVDRWHESSSELTLYDFLGMTWDEYASWVDGPWVLPYIVTAHKEGKSLDEVLASAKETKLAARAADADRANQLIDWLQGQGKLG